MFFRCLRDSLINLTYQNRFVNNFFIFTLLPRDSLVTLPHQLRLVNTFFENFLPAAAPPESYNGLNRFCFRHCFKRLCYPIRILRFWQVLFLFFSNYFFTFVFCCYYGYKMLWSVFLIRTVFIPYFLYLIFL